MLSWMITALAIFWVIMLVAKVVPRLQVSKPIERKIVIVCSVCHDTEEITQEEMNRLYGGPEWVKFKCSTCRGGGSAGGTGGKG